MSDEPDLTRMAVEVEPGQSVAHVITLVVTTTLEDFDESVKVVMTPHTPRVHALGILSDAIEQVKDAAYDTYPDDDEGDY